MKVGILVYDGCVQFEVDLAAFLIRQKHEMITFGLEVRDHESAEGFLLRPHRLLADLDPDVIDAFIIPGGEPEPILGNVTLNRTLRNLNGRGKLLAAICGGPIHLSQAGVLQGRRFTSTLYATRASDFLSGTYIDEDVVVDDNIITAWPNAFVDFALILGDRLQIFKDQADREETVRIFREFKRE